MEKVQEMLNSYASDAMKVNLRDVLSKDQISSLFGEQYVRPKEEIVI